MSYIVKGGELPKNCLNCAFCSYDQDRCIQLDKDLVIYGDRPSWCPLVPLPAKHGRLIDAREVLEKADKAPWFDGDVSELGLLLGKEVTTIYEAEPVFGTEGQE